MESGTLPDAKVIGASGDFVAVAGDTATHATVERVVNGAKVKRCAIYPDLTCDEHRKNADLAGLFIRGRFPAPTSIWVSGAQKELVRKGGVRRPDDLLADLKAASEKLPGPRVSRTDYEPVAGPLGEGEKALAAEQYAVAIDRFSKVAASRIDVLKKLGEARLAQVRKVGDQLLADGKTYLSANEPKNARPYFELLAKEFAALECGQQGAELLKTLPEK